MLLCIYFKDLSNKNFICPTGVLLATSGASLLSADHLVQATIVPGVCPPRLLCVPGWLGALEGEEPCGPPLRVRGRGAQSGDMEGTLWGPPNLLRAGTGGDWKHFPEKGGLHQSSFQKAFVLFHTETIKALKQGFGAELNRVPSQAHRLLPFYWSACSLQFMPLRLTPATWQPMYRGGGTC